MSHRELSRKVVFFRPSSYLLRGWVSVFTGIALLLSYVFDFSSTTIFFISLIILIAGGELFLRGALIELKRGYFGFNGFISAAVLSAFAFSITNSVTGSLLLPVTGFILILPLTLCCANFIKARELARVNRSFKFMDMLDNFISKSAYVEDKGKIIKVFAGEVKQGQTILIKTGDRVPLDCIITKGATLADERLLTGNITLASKQKGDMLFAGSINKGGEVYCEVKAARAFTKMAKIVNAVKESEHRKIDITSPLEIYSTRYFLFFTIFAVCITGLLAFNNINPYYLISSFLFIVAVSGPVAYMAAVLLPLKFVKMRALKSKIKINNISALEEVFKSTKFFIDKTGTLTTGRLEVSQIVPAQDVSQEDLLKAAFTAQKDNNNIFSDALCAYAQEHKIKADKLVSIQLFPSYGTSVKTAKSSILAGRKVWLEEQGVEIPIKNEDNQKTVFYIAKNGKFLGAVYFTDRLRANAKSTVEFLKEQGKSVCLISGDNVSAVAFAAKKCKVEEFYGDMYPDGKAAKISAQQNMGERVVMVGDGFNDILALLQASCSIAFTFSGSAFTGWVDIALNGKDFNGIKTVFQLYRRQYLIVRQNVYISIMFSLLIVYGLLSGGIFGAWYNLSIFIMVSILFIILNSARLLK